MPITVVWLNAPEAKLTPNSRAGAAIHVAETHFQQDLLLHRRNLHPQQVDALAERGGHGHDAFCGDHVFYRAADKCGFIFVGDVDVLVGEIARQLLPHRVETHRAQAHREIVEQAVAAFLPDNQRSLARQPSR